MVKKLLLTLLFVALSPLLIAVVSFAMLVVVVLSLYTWGALRWRSWRRGSWFYLVYSPKAGWNEFVENNLLPVLPGSVTAIAIERKAQDPLTFALQSVVSGGIGISKPFLARVTFFGIRAQSLNADLSELKKFGARNEQLQQLLRKFIEARVSK